MKHLEFLLIQSENMTKQQAMFGPLFEEFSTYEEIVNGTPKLSLVFELSKAYAEGKILLVDHSIDHWNQFFKEIRMWFEKLFYFR